MSKLAAQKKPDSKHSDHKLTGDSKGRADMKIVGRRSGEIAPTPENANILLHTMRQLRGGRGLCPRGVYRFKSFEEAHEWMIEMIARSTRESRR